MKTLLIAGGTGGHLTPALALANQLKVHGPCSILSTARPADRTFSAQSSIEWLSVELQQFTPLWRWLLPSFTFRQLLAFCRIWLAVRRVRPDVAIGFGGYLSAVGVAAAWSLHIPSVIHEQNLIPGRANRLLTRLARGVAVSFPETKGHLSPHTMVEVTGNPLRPQMGFGHDEEARAHFRFDLKRPILFVVGGSQGSQAVNRAVLSMWSQMPAEDRRRIQVVHVTGSQEFPQAKEQYQRLGIESRVYPFLSEIHLAYGCASLAIARAGATTIAELVASQLPAILIPYPYAGGHQRANAQWMEGAGGAVLLEQAELTPQRLRSEVENLLFSPERLRGMRIALAAKKDGCAAEKLEGLVRKVAG